MLTDDSGGPSSPGKEPMTPPTTPPGSELGRGGRGEKGWSKMMMRLGSKKVGRRRGEDEEG